MTKNKKKNYIVEKSNPILEARNDMTLQQLRFFSIYLALINPLDENTKRVSLPLKTVSNLLKVELNELAVRKMGKACMQLYIDLADFDKEAKKRGAMRLRHMFQKFDVDKDDDGVWMVTMQADEDILPYLFDIKSMGYLKYSLYNVLTLEGKVQIKLYETLKLGQGLKNYTLALDDLKARIGVSDMKSYIAYKKFKQAVLDRCIKEINEKTDIRVKFEEIRGPGRGRPVHAIRFYVLKNRDWIDPLNVDVESLEPDLNSADSLSQVPEKAPEQNAPDPDNPEQANPAPDPEHKAELDYYMEAVPEKVKQSRAYHPEELQEKILSVYPGISISAQMQYLRIATSRYLSRLHTGEKIRSHPKYYRKILQNVLEENLLNPPAASATGEAENQNQKKNVPGSSFHDFEQREYDYDELLRKIKEMPRKNECE